MKHNPNSPMWQKVALSVLCVVLALILIAMLFVTAYANRLMGLINRVPTGDSPEFSNYPTLPQDSQQSTADLVPPNEMIKHEGVVNILLVGQDRQPGEPRQRSDAMILMSCNLTTGNITMISFLRDSYVYIPGYRDNKLNAAYVYGGFECLNQTLAVNFGIHVDANVEVDFDGFRGIIDLLGGVDISLTQAEVHYLRDLGYTGLQVGMNHMNGDLALEYSRIRKIDSDAARAGRQRTVITALINKYKDQSLADMLGLLERILPLITTDMTNDQIVTYIWDLSPLLSTAQLGAQQIPAAGTFENTHVGDIRDAKVMDMAANREILRKLLENP